MSYSTLLTQAKEFRKSFGVKSSETQVEMQKALIDEEWSEFHESYHMGTDEEELKELCDLVYVCYQYAANLGWDLDEAMDRVHKSNMSKLGEDGKPLYRADGKVLKGPNYQPPNLKDLIKNA
jgi:predicted HAD superfamily Cof-like phosphohydrolase